MCLPALFDGFPHSLFPLIQEIGFLLQSSVFFAQTRSDQKKFIVHRLNISRGVSGRGQCRVDVGEIGRWTIQSFNLVIGRLFIAWLKGWEQCLIQIGTIRHCRLKWLARQGEQFRRYGNDKDLLPFAVVGRILAQSERDEQHRSVRTKRIILIRRKSVLDWLRIFSLPFGKSTTDWVNYGQRPIVYLSASFSGRKKRKFRRFIRFDETETDQDPFSCPSAQVLWVIPTGMKASCLYFYALHQHQQYRVPMISDPTRCVFDLFLNNTCFSIWTALPLSAHSMPTIPLSVRNHPNEPMKNNDPNRKRSIRAEIKALSPWFTWRNLFRICVSLRFIVSPRIGVILHHCHRISHPSDRHSPTGKVLYL